MNAQPKEVRFYEDTGDVISKPPMNIGLIIGGVMAKKPSTSYSEDLTQRLKDPEYAVEYLRATLEESDMPELFLLALRNVAEPRKPCTK